MIRLMRRLILSSRGRVAIASLLCLAAASTLLAAPPPRTPRVRIPPLLRRIMSAPLADDLTAARQAPVVAWLFTLDGVRNIWAARGPEFHAFPVTHYTGDNGVGIYSPRLTPDGRFVVYARGDERNASGQIADPSHNIHPPAQNVWLAPLSGGAPRRLGAMGCTGSGCEDIEISPNGKYAAWAARGAIWLANLKSQKPARKLAWLRGHSIEPRWSPGSRQLAFVSDRGSHSFIVLYRLGASHLRYLAPNFDRDTLPRWSPHGRYLAFIRQPGETLVRPIIPIAPHPWSIWVGNPRTLTAHRIWSSGGRPRDWLPQQTEAEAFRFLAGGRISFSSWRGGWLHLYAIAAQGGAAQCLTPGRFDVKDVSASPNGHWLLYSSNQNDLQRRHIWRVRVAGQGMPGAPEALTRGRHLQWTPVEAGGGAIVYIGAGPRLPSLPYLWTSHGARALARRVIPAAFPRRRLIIPRDVSFASLDGLRLHGQLFVPRGGKRPRAGIVYIHGGPMRQMMPGWNPMRYYFYAYAENQFLALRGFEVLSVNYRGGIMYGWAFRHPPHYGWRGAAEYQDIVAAGKFLARRPGVNPRAIGLWGGSWGGYLTALGLARNSNLFAAGVDMHGVHDWAAMLNLPAPWRQVPDLKAARRLAWRSSPDASMCGWRSPVLLIQGDDDREVPFNQSVDLAVRLRQHHVPFQTLVLPDEVHMFLRWKSWLKAYAAAERFFASRLAGGKDVK